MCKQEIKNALVNGLHFLTDISYVFSEFSVSESQASGKFYSVTYTSTTYRRKVNTTFLPKSASIRCSLINIEDDFCFTDISNVEAMTVISRRTDAGCIFFLDYRRAIELGLMFLILSVVRQ
ncbi:MAG: hypothetical protein Q7S87_15540 [Agitococcus sp.]|nr:hypothetical protein [Agitococcus sp.]